MLNSTQRQNYATKFMELYQSDKNARYRSYDHAHSVYIQNRRDNNPETLDYVALHLFAFLGSWGMISRGAVLMNKDYRFLIPILKILNKSDYDKLCDIDLTDSELNKEWYVKTVTQLIDEIKNYFNNEVYYKLNLKTAKNEPFEWENVTDTVIGKILMVTLGCLPAYDQYVVKGMRKERLCGELGKRSFGELVEYSKEHVGELKQIQGNVNNIVRENGSEPLIYPIAKILDMIFWEYGIELDLSAQEK